MRRGLSSASRFTNTATVKAFLLLLVCGLPCSTLEAKLYKWVDENGVAHFSETPPADQQKQDFEAAELDDDTSYADPECCAVVRAISWSFSQGAPYSISTSQLERFNMNQKVLDELSQFVASKRSSGLNPNQVGESTYHTCMNGRLLACSAASAPAVPELPGENGQRSAQNGAKSGSGFVVAPGHILTNAHVVEGCSSVKVSNSPQYAAVIARDRQNDLALVRNPNPQTPIAPFRADNSVILAENVMAAGFPLSGILGSGLNITAGTVSALSGPQDDPRFIQITAPVQAGNSGGPLLDSAGQVIGIVTAKLNALAIARYSGDLPQNINFAIRAELAKDFLRRNQVSFTPGSAQQAVAGTSVGAAAQGFTVQLECNPATS